MHSTLLNLIKTSIAENNGEWDDNIKKRNNNVKTQLALRFYLLGSDKVKCDENGRLESPF